MKPSNKDLVLVGLFFLIAVITFFLGRNSYPRHEEIKLPDNKQHEKSIDSLVSLNRDLKITNNRLFETLDSLKSVKVINNKKYIKATNEVKNFTPTTRHNFNDSVLRANGIK